MFPCYSLHTSHPLFPLPTTMSIVCSLCLSPLLPCKQFHQYHLSRFHIYVLVYGICFSLSDLLHCIIGSRFAHLIKLTQMHPFLWLTNIVCMYHSFFIHSSADGHLGCFHALAIVNSAAMNTGVHVSFSILVSSGYMPRSGIAGSYGGFIPSF